LKPFWGRFDQIDAAASSADAKAPDSKIATIHVGSTGSDYRKNLEIKPAKWEIPTMTVVADSKKRITLRIAKPGDRFDVQVVSAGSCVLTKLEPVRQKSSAKVRIEKRGRYHVGVLDHPINEEAIKEALAEFP
jgi:hypothetical protein